MRLTEVAESSFLKMENQSPRLGYRGRYVYELNAPMVDLLQIRVSTISPGFIRVSAFGTAGIGSDGNQHGRQIHDAIEDAIDASSPSGILIDLCELDYEFGNYIGTACLGQGFPHDHMCVLASGKSHIALRNLWQTSRFDRLVPLFDDEAEAIDYITR